MRKVSSNHQERKVSIKIKTEETDLNKETRMLLMEPQESLITIWLLKKHSQNLFNTFKASQIKKYQWMILQYFWNNWQGLFLNKRNLSFWSHYLRMTKRLRLMYCLLTLSLKSILVKYPQTKSLMSQIISMSSESLTLII